MFLNGGANTPVLNVETVVPAQFEFGVNINFIQQLQDINWSLPFVIDTAGNEASYAPGDKVWVTNTGPKSLSLNEEIGLLPRLTNIGSRMDMMTVSAHEYSKYIDDLLKIVEVLAQADLREFNFQEWETDPGDNPLWTELWSAVSANSAGGSVGHLLATTFRTYWAAALDTDIIKGIHEGLTTIMNNNAEILDGTNLGANNFWERKELLKKTLTDIYKLGAHANNPRVKTIGVVETVVNWEVTPGTTFVINLTDSPLT